MSKQFVQNILDLFEEIAHVRSRRMFGGYGLYVDDVIFAIVIEETLYFKVDDFTRSFFEEVGSKPFSYEKNNGTTVVMSYFEVPSIVFDDFDSLKHYFSLAKQAAFRAKK